MRALPPESKENGDEPSPTNSTDPFHSPTPMKRFMKSVSLPPIETELENAETKKISPPPSPKRRSGRKVFHKRATDLGIKGGRSVDEVLKRNHDTDSIYEHFSQEEMTRMHRVFKLYRP